MGSAKRPDLDDVRSQFEAWRAGPRDRVIPNRLWLAACELLDRHAPSTVCRHLHLNPSRFIERRQAIGGARAEELMRRRSASGAQVSRRRRGTHVRRQVAQDRSPRDVDQRGGAFLELPPVARALAPETAQVASLTARRSAAAAVCRLELENRAGVRVTVLLAEVDHALIDAVCRRVLEQ